MTTNEDSESIVDGPTWVGEWVLTIVKTVMAGGMLLFAFLYIGQEIAGVL